jgi:hypothetical protein
MATVTGDRVVNNPLLPGGRATCAIVRASSLFREAPVRRLWAFGCRVTLLLALGIFVINVISVGVAYPWLGAIALAAASWRITHRGYRL